MPNALFRKSKHIYWNSIRTHKQRRPFFMGVICCPIYTIAVEIFCVFLPKIPCFSTSCAPYDMPLLPAPTGRIRGKFNGLHTNTRWRSKPAAVRMCQKNVWFLCTFSRFFPMYHDYFLRYVSWLLSQIFKSIIKRSLESKMQPSFMDGCHFFGSYSNRYISGSSPLRLCFFTSSF